MPPKRPGVVTAAAVLAIIYGSLFTLCGLCGAIGQAAQGAMGANMFAGNDPQQAKIQKEMQDNLERDIPGYRAVQVGGTVVGLVESVMLLVGGIGLLSMQPWARTVVLVFGIIAIVTTALQACYLIAIVMPATNNAMQGAIAAAAPPGAAGPPPAQVQQALELVMTIATVGAAILYVLVIIYIGIILILLTRPHVRAAFAMRGHPALDAGLMEQERRPRVAEYEEDEGWERPPGDNPKDERIR
ncbi:MAG: hypothetical protein HY040_04160 [Planctomycetes bacterium]|nr:hypothetical protein [Planctomycetota bacterium]